MDLQVTRLIGMVPNLPSYGPYLSTYRYLLFYYYKNLLNGDWLMEQLYSWMKRKSIQVFTYITVPILDHSYI